MTNDVTNSNGRVTVDEVIHRDSVFRYQLLDRLRSDCEYYLNYGNRHPKTLWAGYSFYVMKGKCRLTVHPKSKSKMKSRLKELTNRSNGWGYVKRKQKLKEYIRGWIGYYHLADMKRLLLDTDEWLRRRIRMCIWKAWKTPKTKVANLVKCGIGKYKAWEWGNTRKGYWRIADSPILKVAINNDSLRKAGYYTLMGSYLEWYPK